MYTGAFASGLHNPVYDVLVTGAAAEIARQPSPNGIRVVGPTSLEPRRRGHQHAGRADAALGGTCLLESPLQQVQSVRAAERFDRAHGSSLDLTHRHETAVDRLPVEKHGARPALPFATPFLRPRQAEVLAQHIEQPPERGPLNVHSPPVDHEARGP
jgi:hypothetical protein